MKPKSTPDVTDGVETPNGGSLHPVVRHIVGYATSKDHAKLAELMTTQSIVCICRYNTCRDVCQSVYDGRTWMLNARGIGYIYAYEVKDFIAQCEQAEVEWLVPNAELCGSAAKPKGTQ
jgi:hypothetical protein